MTRLSVNVNKVASLRNARGGNNPNLIQVVKDCESYGAEGITVHPRPDERHITLNDVYDISKIVRTNYNIEGYPDNRFLKIIRDIKPEQATLVPDAPEVVTSNRGWKSSDDNVLLRNVVSIIHKYGVKVSLFIDPDFKMIECARDCGVDRVELYTGKYAKNYLDNKETSVFEYIEASKYAISNGLQVNAGHDLDLNNLKLHHSLYSFILNEKGGIIDDIIISKIIFDTLEYFFIVYNASRKKIVLVGSNGGMLHAFDDASGEELWAFIPPNILPRLREIISSQDYETNSISGVDDTPVVKDIYYDHDDNGSKTWRTIALTGLGRGGKGLFALDITDTENPSHLFTIDNNTGDMIVTFWDADGEKKEFSYKGAPISQTNFDYSRLGNTTSTVSYTHLTLPTNREV